MVHATDAHVPDIVRLVGELRAQEDLPPTVSAETVRAYIAEPQTEVLVAVASRPTDGREDATSAGLGAGLVVGLVVGPVVGPVVGLLTLRVLGDLFHDGTSALVQELIVDAAWRRRGIGGALLDAAIERADELGCAEVGVSTGIENPDAQALYRSRGFEADCLWFERHLER